MERLYVAVAALSEEPDNVLKKNSDCFLDKLTPYRDRVVILLGGYWGLMRYIADRAVEKGFTVVFILPDNPPVMPPNNEKTVIIQTDLGFPTRSTVMCKSGDILVAMGGSIGSIIEIMLSYDFGKSVVIVESGRETDKVWKCFGNYIDHRRKAEIKWARNGCEAAEHVIEIIPHA